jgi:hypothetical protein
MDPSIKINPNDLLEVLRVNGAPPEEDLQTALAKVDRDIFDAVTRVLYDAKVEKIRGELEGRQIDFAREFSIRRKSASLAAKNFRRLLGVPSLSWLDDRKLDALKGKWPFPNRRKTEGRHHQPWIEKARKKLKRLGVSREDSEELLLACGIRRPRHRTITAKESLRR